MHILTHSIHIETKADGGMHDITRQVDDKLQDSGLQEGNLTLFCAGSTFSVSTVEFEPGLCADVPRALARIAPENIKYQHHETWHDDNGRSHVKATLMGPSLVIPFLNGQLALGTWQQIVVCEWDTRPRKRQLILQFFGL